MPAVPTELRCYRWGRCFGVAFGAGIPLKKQYKIRSLGKEFIDALQVIQTNNSFRQSFVAALCSKHASLSFIVVLPGPLVLPRQRSCPKAAAYLRQQQMVYVRRPDYSLFHCFCHRHAWYCLYVLLLYIQVMLQSINDVVGRPKKDD